MSHVARHLFRWTSVGWENVNGEEESGVGSMQEQAASCTNVGVIWTRGNNEVA